MFSFYGVSIVLYPILALKSFCGRRTFHPSPLSSAQYGQVRTTNFEVKVGHAEVSD